MDYRCDVDCDEGRRMGCQTYCCRLLVRLDPDERVPNEEGLAEKGYVDKAEDGYCIHFDRQTCRCSIWPNRPRICRQYDCNADHMLQAALRKRFRNIVELARHAYELAVSKQEYIRIPYSTDDDDNTRPHSATSP